MERKDVKISLTKVSKTFVNISSLEVLKNISVSICNGEFLVFLGPSGCGKTTLLRIIAGLESATSGEILLDNKPIEKSLCKIGVVFQSYTCFPWLTVEKNIEFGLFVKKIEEKERKEIVSFYLKLMGLERFRTFYPKMLSGGMKQRVALARTMAISPEILLLDEPFGALDYQTREEMQSFLLEVWGKNRKTVILVTHDVEEAIFLSDRIILLGQIAPCTVTNVFRSNFSRPRSLDLKFNPEFIKLKEKIIKSMRKFDISRGVLLQNKAINIAEK